RGARGRAFRRPPKVSERNALRRDRLKNGHLRREVGRVPAEWGKAGLIDADIVDHDHENVRRPGRARRRGRGEWREGRSGEICTNGDSACTTTERNGGHDDLSLMTRIGAALKSSALSCSPSLTECRDEHQYERARRRWHGGEGKLSRPRIALVD